MTQLIVQKIVSGGQTGVDRAALDVAIFLDIPHGGWCPKGRLAEDGVIPAVYQLCETDSRDYAVRTEKNVVHSDGTLILFRSLITGGTDLTRKLASRHRRPLMTVDLDLANDNHQSVTEVRQWVSDSNIRVLNVAGPRASSQANIGGSAEKFLLRVFSDSP